MLTIAGICVRPGVAREWMKSPSTGTVTQFDPPMSGPAGSRPLSSIPLRMVSKD
jgi:hypothetical protein